MKKLALLTGASFALLVSVVAMAPVKAQTTNTEQSVEEMETAPAVEGPAQPNVEQPSNTPGNTPANPEQNRLEPAMGTPEAMPSTPTGNTPANPEQNRLEPVMGTPETMPSGQSQMGGQEMQVVPAVERQNTQEQMRQGDGMMPSEGTTQMNNSGSGYNETQYNQTTTIPGAEPVRALW